jgi:hypothetical protein
MGAILRRKYREYENDCVIIDSSDDTRTMSDLDIKHLYTRYLDKCTARWSLEKSVAVVDAS